MARFFANTGGDFLNLGDLSAMDGLPKFTFGGWFNPTASNLEIICGRLDGAVTPYFQKIAATDVWRMNVNDGGGASETTFSHSASDWVHIVGTFDGTEAVATDRCQIYISGEITASTGGTHPTTLGTSTNPFYFGAITGAGRNNGEMAEIGFWNDLLTPAEIAQFFRAQLPFDPTIEEKYEILPRFENLLFYERCDGNNPERNLVSHKHNGIVNGDPSIVRHPYDIEVRDDVLPYLEIAVAAGPPVGTLSMMGVGR